MRRDFNAWVTRPYGIGLHLGLAAACLTTLVGCAEAERPARVAVPPAATALDAASPRTEPAATPEEPTGSDKDIPPPAPTAPDRKIIYNAQVDLVVESVAATAESLMSLVRQSGGYIAQADVMSELPRRSHALWKIRVPIARFDAFVAAVARLGRPEKNHVDSQDVTETFYDLEARINNKKEEEKRLLRHLSDSTGKLEEILVVERELSRVRGEIEQMQGRLRYLSDVTAMSTVTITATEQPAVPPVASFGKQVAETFRTSLSLLADLGKAVVLLAAAVAPWIPLLGIVALLLLWPLRRIRRAQAP